MGLFLFIPFLKTRLTMMLRFLFTLIIAAISSLTFAQVQQSGWLASFNTFRLTHKTSIHFDAQWRSSDRLRHMQTLLLRTGLNYKISPITTLTGGYAYISNRKSVNGITGYSPEHRIWQQALVAYKVKNIAVAHRFRLEQRFMGRPKVENDRLVNEGSNYASRFRYFTRNIIPFARKDFHKGVFAAVQNELFLNFGNTQTVNGKTFDQNRLYLALGYKVHSRFSFDFGYLNQYINGRDNAFVNNHIIQLAAYTSL